MLGQKISTTTTKQFDVETEAATDIAQADVTKATSDWAAQIPENVGLATGVGFKIFKLASVRFFYYLISFLYLPDLASLQHLKNRLVFTILTFVLRTKLWIVNPEKLLENIYEMIAIKFTDFSFLEHTYIAYLFC